MEVIDITEEVEKKDKLEGCKVSQSEKDEITIYLDKKYGKGKYNRSVWLRNAIANAMKRGE